LVCSVQQKGADKQAGKGNISKYKKVAAAEREDKASMYLQQQQILC
jgi:hypothetical protein